MKKVSTVVARQGRNNSRQKLTIGLDLGDRNSWYCVLDEAGGIQREQRVRTTAKALQEVFGAMPRSRVALEIGTHSPWISRLLSELGHEVIVANARKVRPIGESRKKDDRLDAQTLARLARIDPELLYPVKHRSAQAQTDLMMIRARAGLVRARTGLVNMARGLARSYGERLRGCNVRDMDPEKAENLTPELQRVLEPLLSAIAELSEKIVKYNDRIEALAQASYPQVELLKQIKGVGTLIALTFLLTLEDPHRFGAGIWVAPGSPYKNMDKTLSAIRYARENDVPCFGTCGGFQHIVIEYARNVLGYRDAHHAEYDPYASSLFISSLTCSLAGREMPLSFVPGSKVAQIYGTLQATENYYCNFGVNPDMVSLLKNGPMQIAGSDREGEIRVLELPNHPFFIATLFVPQLRSRVDRPHPLVTAFLKAVSESGAPDERNRRAGRVSVV